MPSLSQQWLDGRPFGAVNDTPDISPRLINALAESTTMD